MRLLKAKDLAPALRVVNKAGIREEIVRMSDKVKDGNEPLNTREIGVEVIFNILANAGDEAAEKAVFEFLAGPFEMEPDEIRELDLAELIEKLKEAVDLNKETLQPFFGSLAGLIRKNLST